VNTPYDRTAQADTNSKLHFVLLGHRHGSYELGGICLRHESSLGLGVILVRTTMGMIIRPMNVFGMSNLFAVSSIDSTTKQSRISATGRPLYLILLLTKVCDECRSDSNGQKATKTSERKIKILPVEAVSPQTGG
jgi:hypothetical protein